MAANSLENYRYLETDNGSTPLPSSTESKTNRVCGYLLSMPLCKKECSSSLLLSAKMGVSRIMVKSEQTVNLYCARHGVSSILTTPTILL